MGTIRIVVLSYNGLQDTRKCLGSLVHALRQGVTPLLVDNGSTDGTGEAVAMEFPWCRVLRVETNRGPAAGNNAGMRTALDASCDWILLLNNDTIVDSTLIDRLREAVSAHPEYAVIGPVIKFMDDPDVVMTDGCLFNRPGLLGFFQREVVPLTGTVPPSVTDVDVVNGCCMFVRSDMIRSIGLFDESMFIYHDETDLCLRAAEAGYRAGVIDHALVWHKGSATFKSSGKRSARYYDARNLCYVLRRHAGVHKPGRPPLRSFVAYFRYMYYWYCSERESGHDQSADAVIEGIVDGVTRRQGAYDPERHRVIAPLRMGFELLRHRPRRSPAAVSR